MISSSYSGIVEIYFYFHVGKSSNCGTVVIVDEVISGFIVIIIDSESASSCGINISGNAMSFN